MSARVHVGTSGWNYGSWKDAFYAGVPRKAWFEHATRAFTGLEINATHYREQTPETLSAWRQRAPRGFRFAVKGHRFVTHAKKLLEVDDSVIRARENLRPLGASLAAVVWQLPDSLRRDDRRLAGFLAALDLWRSTRHALELRHASWFSGEVAALLAEHDVAVCQSDAPDFPLWDAVTTDLVYVRLHGHTRKYASRYSTRLLESWAAKVERWRGEGREVHVYFDNDAEGHAPRDAARLLALLRS